MGILSALHGLSDLSTAAAYMVIAWGVFLFSGKRPRYRKVSTLFMLFIFFCGVAHFTHIVFGPGLLDSELVRTLASVVNAGVSVLAAVTLYPLFPELMTSQTAEEVEGLIEERLQEMGLEIAAKERILAELRCVSRLRCALSELNKAIARIQFEPALLGEACAILRRHGRALAVSIDALPDGASHVPLDACVPSLRGRTLGHGRVPMRHDTGGEVEFVVPIILDGSGYLLCAVYPSTFEVTVDYAEFLTEVAADLEYALKKIDGARRLAQSEVERQSYQDKLEFLASHDQLTEMLNRQSLETAVEHLIKRSADVFAVFFLDLDHFKSVNDTMGHHFGDLLLKNVAAKLRGALRRTDYVGRQGGDEFVAIVRVANAVEAETLALKILQVVGTEYSIDGRALSIGVSVGIALHPRDGATYHDLFTKADAALYVAKNSGKNRYEFYAADSRRPPGGLHLESMLRRDLAAGALDVVFQPQVSLATRRIVGAEALARWSPVECGPVAAPVFFQIAEYSGLIHQLGLAVIELACSQWRACVDRGMPPLRLSINVSAIQLRDASFPETLLRVVDRHVPRALLTVELTETVFAVETSTVTALDSLRAAGLAIAIDDFGTGHSNLSYLQALRVDEIKIDKSFVANLDGPQNSVIVKSIVLLAQDLGLATVAEGVETDQQRQALLALGCDHAQGYLFHRPLAVDALFEAVTAQESN